MRVTKFEIINLYPLESLLLFSDSEWLSTEQEYFLDGDNWSISEDEILIAGALVERCEDGKGFYYPTIGSGYIRRNRADGWKREFILFDEYAPADASKGPFPDAIFGVGRYVGVVEHSMEGSLYAFWDRDNGEFIRESTTLRSDLFRWSLSAQERIFIGSSARMHSLDVLAFEQGHLTWTFSESNWSYHPPYQLDGCLLICGTKELIKLDISTGSVILRSELPQREEGSEVITGFELPDHRIGSWSRDLGLPETTLILSITDGTEVESYTVLLSDMIPRRTLEQPGMRESSDTRVEFLRSKDGRFLFATSAGDSDFASPGGWAFVEWRMDQPSKIRFQLMSNAYGFSDAFISERLILVREGEHRLLQFDVEAVYDSFNRDQSDRFTILMSGLEQIIQNLRDDLLSADSLRSESALETIVDLVLDEGVEASKLLELNLLIQKQVSDGLPNAGAVIDQRIWSLFYLNGPEMLPWFKNVLEKRIDYRLHNELYHLAQIFQKLGEKHFDVELYALSKDELAELAADYVTTLSGSRRERS